MSIKTAVLNGVATLEIARPEKKNALTAAMYQAMAEGTSLNINKASCEQAARATGAAPKATKARRRVAMLRGAR